MTTCQNRKSLDRGLNWVRSRTPSRWPRQHVTPSRLCPWNREEGAGGREHIPRTVGGEPSIVWVQLAGQPAVTPPEGLLPHPIRTAGSWKSGPGSLAKGGTFPTSACSGLKAWPGLGSGLSFAFLTSQLVSLNLTPHLKKKIRESPAAVRTRCPEHQARGSDGARAQG